jgi:hypothetical protein
MTGLRIGEAQSSGGFQPLGARRLDGASTFSFEREVDRFDHASGMI